MLKSFVSFLVLLSFISSIHPSHAGNSGNGGEKDPERKGIPVSRQQQTIGPNFQEVAQNPERTLAVLYEKVTERDEELQKSQVLLELSPEGLSLGLKLFFDQDIFDQGIKKSWIVPNVTPETLLKLQSVCKHWDTIIRDFRKRTLNYITLVKDEELENLKPADLNQFLLNPESFLLLHKRLAFMSASKLSLSLPTETYAALIRDNREFQPYFTKLCVKFFNFPQNSEEIRFAVFIIRKSEGCQELILQERKNSSILEKNAYFQYLQNHEKKIVFKEGQPQPSSWEKFAKEIMSFPELVEHPKNFRSLQQYLKTMLYISKSSHPSANIEKSKQEKFSSSLYYYFDNKIQELKKEGYELFSKQNPHYLNQPFWSIYDPCGVSVNYQLKLLEMYADTPLAAQLNREKIEVFWEYVNNYYSDLCSTYKVSMANLLYNLPYAIPDELAPLYNGVNPNNLDRVMLQVVEPYMNVNNYKEALKVLEHSYTISQQLKSPFRHQILFKMAECNLFVGNLPEARKYIKDLREEFLSQKAFELDTTFKSTPSLLQGSSKKIPQSPRELPALAGSDARPSDPYEKPAPHDSKDRLFILHMKQVDCLRVGLALRGNDTANVKEAMDRLEPHDIFYGEFSEPILTILKSQLSSQALSKDLKKLLGHEAEKGFSLDFFKAEQGQKRLSKYGVVFDFLLKEYFEWRPLKKQKFNKLKETALTLGQ